jgi:hypothetical protein
MGAKAPKKGKMNIKTKRQLVINKYEKRFNIFMNKFAKDINEEKAFKGIKGSAFCGMLIEIRKEINIFLRNNRKGA